MPNWCSNAIIVTGNQTDLRRFDEQFKKRFTAIHGATSFIPNSGEFKPKLHKLNVIAYLAKPTEHGGQEVTYIHEIEEREGYSFSNFAPMSKDDFLNGWHDWAIKHWGTKWDLSADDIHPPDILDTDTQEIVYSFMTAWSPCEPVVAAMAKQYPMLDFAHEYDEGGCSFAGKTTYEHGVEHTRLETDENMDYRTFCAEILGHEEMIKCTVCNQYYYDDECDNCE